MKMPRSMQEREKEEGKKPYHKPAIVFSRKVEARAVQCVKAGDSCGPGGPLTS